MKDAFTMILVLIFGFTCSAQTPQTVSDIENCFDKINLSEAWKVHKNHQIRFNNCEKAHYVFDTIAKTKTKITIEYSEYNGAIRFKSGFLFKGGDLKYLYTVQSKPLIRNAHFINFSDKDSIISAFICGGDWLFMNYLGDTLNFNHCGEQMMNYVPTLDNALNMAKILKSETVMIGYLDKKGKWVIQPRFSDAQEFVNGFAKVKINNKWGLINEKGDYVIEPTYVTADDVPKY